MFHLSAAFLSVCLGYWDCKLFATETFQDTFFFLLGIMLDGNIDGI